MESVENINCRSLSIDLEKPTDRIAKLLIECAGLPSFCDLLVLCLQNVVHHDIPFDNHNSIASLEPCSVVSWGTGCWISSASTVWEPSSLTIVLMIIVHPWCSYASRLTYRTMYHHFTIFFIQSKPLSIKIWKPRCHQPSYMHDVIEKEPNL